MGQNKVGETVVGMGRAAAGIDRVWRAGLVMMMLSLVAACASKPPPPPPVVVEKPQVTTPSQQPSSQPDLPPLPPAPNRNEARFQTPNFVDRENVVRVGLLLPIRASDQGVRSVAAALRNAAELALFEFADKDVLMMIYDTRGQSDRARKAGDQALREGADIIIGPLFSDSVKAIAPAAQRQQVPVIAFSSDSSAASRGVYLLSFLPENDVDRVVAYAAANGAERFAALVPSGAYGTRISGALRKAAADRGAALTQVVSFGSGAAEIAAAVSQLLPPGERRQTPTAPQTPSNQGVNPAAPASPAGETQTDARPAWILGERYAQAEPADADALQELEGAAPEPEVTPQSTAAVPMLPLAYDAVLIAEGGQALRTIGAQLAQQNISASRAALLGTGVWSGDNLSKVSGLSGAVYPAPPPAMHDQFATRYKRNFGATPPEIASLAYDAMSLAITLARRPDGQGFTEAVMTDPDGFVGVDGIFRFTSDGLNQRGLAILEVTPAGVQVRDPAPTSFADTLPGS